MYYFKMSTDEIKDYFKNVLKKDFYEVAEEVGIAQSYMSMLINKRRSCSKFLAYYLTKYMNSEAEIEDFFERK